tara:strand:- start:84 stop:977 length:894 start_codon:yes stop_codon:yes gene_type:complete
MGTFVCDKCDYSTSNRAHYDRHCGTSKHLKKIAGEPESAKLTLHMYELLELKYQHEQEKNAMQTNFINIFAGTINKKAPKMPTLDMSGNVSSDEESEQPKEQPKEPKLKKCPDWVPENSFEDIESQLPFEYEVMDDFQKESEFDEGKQVPDMESYVNTYFGKLQKEEYLNNYECAFFRTSFFKNILHKVEHNKDNKFPVESTIREYLKEKINQLKIIDVKDASRGKFYLYSYGKWNDPSASAKDIIELTTKIWKEVKFQGCVYNYLCTDPEKTQKVMSAYNFQESWETFINKLLKEL